MRKLLVFAMLAGCAPAVEPVAPDTIVFAEYTCENVRCEDPGVVVNYGDVLECRWRCGRYEAEDDRKVTATFRLAVVDDGDPATDDPRCWRLAQVENDPGECP